MQANSLPFDWSGKPCRKVLNNIVVLNKHLRIFRRILVERKNISQRVDMLAIFGNSKEDCVASSKSWFTWVRQSRSGEQPDFQMTQFYLSSSKQRFHGNWSLGGVQWGTCFSSPINVFFLRGTKPNGGRTIKGRKEAFSSVETEHQKKRILKVVVIIGPARVRSPQWQWHPTSLLG